MKRRDPILEEVWEARDEHARRFHYDLKKICADLRKVEKQFGWRKSSAVFLPGTLPAKGNQMTLEERVESLELNLSRAKVNQRRILIAAIAAISLIGLVSAAKPEQTSSGILRCQRLEVLDSDSNVRISLEPFLFQMKTAKGYPAAQIALSGENNDHPEFEIIASDKMRRAAFGEEYHDPMTVDEKGKIHEHPDSVEPCGVLLSQESLPRARIQLTPRGEPSVKFLGDKDIDPLTRADLENSLKRAGIK